MTFTAVDSSSKADWNYRIQAIVSLGKIKIGFSFLKNYSCATNTYKFDLIASVV